MSYMSYCKTFLSGHLLMQCEDILHYELAQKAKSIKNNQRQAQYSTSKDFCKCANSVEVCNKLVKSIFLSEKKGKCYDDKLLSSFIPISKLSDKGQNSIEINDFARKK